MKNFPLRSFQLSSFRSFSALDIARLGHVNLIVGRNGAGKSCLLESLYLYSHMGAWEAAVEVLSARNEMQISGPSVSIGRLASMRTEEVLDSLRYLFYGRVNLSSNSPVVRFKANDDVDSTVAISIMWLSLDESRAVRPQPLWNLTDGDSPFYQVQVGQGKSTGFSLLSARQSSVSSLRPDVPEIKCTLVSAAGLASLQIAEYWDAIALTDMESEILGSLQIIAPAVQGVNLIATERARNRYPIVRTTGSEKPVPLKSLGDGMTRMLGLSLAAVNARGGILLIDEIENGLHYSVQPDMWRMLFRLASSLNLQVFATSHSWDCIQAFQQIASECKDVEGELIRLDRKGEAVIPTIFDEGELEIVTREQIEVR